MKLCVVGAGYVGLVTGICFAESGNDVWCVDTNEKKVAKLQSGDIPIFEPGLKELMFRSQREERLRFTTKLSEGLKSAEVCFICVDTPSNAKGEADLSSVFQVAKDIGRYLDHYIVVVTKSTVPVGTTYQVERLIQEELKKRNTNSIAFDIASNPEFLKEGNAVQDFLKPDRVVVGVDKEEVGKILHRIYQPFMRKQDRFLQMDISSSELAKYAANAMLATRISFMNSLAQLAEKVGANIRKIQESLGRDPRIGPDFLFAGLGYGGSCFPKDMEALIQLGRQHDSTLPVVEATHQVNSQQADWFLDKILAHFRGSSDLEGKKIAIWGLSFKPNTDDIRHAPSIHLMQRFLEMGLLVSAFDPVATSKVQAIYEDKVVWAGDPYEALRGADALVVCTEWQEFRSPDFDRMLSVMRTPVIFDGRNIYDPLYLVKKGFHYFGIGTPCV